MNTEKPRFTAIYAFLIVAAIVTILSSFFLSCVSWEERSAVDRTKQFNAGLWDRERGEIFDRDKNVLVYNTAGEKENDLDRHYDKCSEAYSAIIGYYGSYVEYIESEDGSEPKKVTHERREGLESSMSEWLLLGDDIENTIGGSIVLTTDSRLQELCYKQIKDFDKAAVVVIDIETGEILALTDAPGYNTHALTSLETIDEYNAAMTDDILFPFATRTQIPGSVFKLVTASVFCHAGIGDLIVDDTGIFEYDGHELKNAENKAYGETDLVKAIRVSSNIFFAEGAKQLGAEKMEKYLVEKWKMDEDIELDFVTLRQNYCLDNRQLLYTTAFGQGDLQISPLQVCMMTAAVGDRNGDYFKPFLFKELINADGKSVRTGKLSSRQIITRKAVTKEARQLILEGMTACAADKNLDNFNGKSAAVKTGTAQIGEDKVNIWMTGLYPSDKPRYAVTIAAFELPKKGNWGSDLSKNIAPIFEALASED